MGSEKNVYYNLDSSAPFELFHPIAATHVVLSLPVWLSVVGSQKLRNRFMSVAIFVLHSQYE